MGERLASRAAKPPALLHSSSIDGRKSVRGVRVFVAPGCHLCERGVEVVEQVCRELGADYAIVDISADPVLETRYRELIPVVEIDGERAFTYFVQPDALRLRLA
jgi:thiol-disulfide isomerase/thioredoxin